MDRTYLDYIEDILNSIDEVESFVEGMSFREFTTDRKTINAVIRSLEVLGEATKNIPQDIRDQHSKVPWGKMAGMRDKLIHEYFGVDLEIVWQAVQEDLPPIKPDIERALKGLDEQEGTSGFTTIELLIGLAILAVLVVGIYTVTNHPAIDRSQISPAPTVASKQTATPVSTDSSESAPTSTNPATNAEGKIAFVRDGDIWLINADGSGEEKITSTDGKISAFVWNKDGSKIYYIETKTLQNYPFEGNSTQIGYKIIERNLNTSKEQVIVDALSDEVINQGFNKQFLNHPLTIASLTISPSGDELIFSRNSLWSVNLNNMELQEILPSQNEISSSIVPSAHAAIISATIYNDLKWSPDGKYLLVKLSLYEAADYFVMNWKTKKVEWQTEVVKDAQRGFRIYPFGFMVDKVVAVKSEPGDPFSPEQKNYLVSISLPTGELTELTQLPEHSLVSLITITREGAPFILYSYKDGALRDSLAQVFLVDHQGNKKMVWEAPSDDPITEPELVFGSFRQGNLLAETNNGVGLFSLNKEQASFQLLTTNASSPAWQPR